MVKKITYMLSAVMLCSIFLAFPLESKAADVPSFNINYEEPSCSDTQGYVALLLKNNSTGAQQVNVFFWCINQTYSNLVQQNDKVGIELNITSSTCTFKNAPRPSSCIYNISCCFSGQCLTMHKGATTNEFTYSYSPNGFSIIGAVYKGNVVSCTSSVAGTFTMVFGADKLQQNTLNNIYSQLVQANANDVTMINKLNQIYNSIDTVESKLQQLIDLQEESNTWLEKIFNWLNESKEEERQEVQTQGSNSVSQGNDAIQNSGEGFTGSMGGLVSSMSYAGTECKWTFPQVKLPAISGVMEETILIEKQDIDFGVWVDKIPSDIMLLIRSVLTGALIIYCFKELYGTISYVLTLKGSGVNE